MVCGLIRRRCRSGYCGRCESSPGKTLRGFSLLISFAPPLRPSCAVAFLLVANGGVIQHAFEEPAEQVQQFQLSMQFHSALGQTFPLDEVAHVFPGGEMAQTKRRLGARLPCSQQDANP